MITFVFYLVLGITAAAGKADSETVPPQPAQQRPVLPLTKSEVSELQARAEKGDTSAQFALGKAYEDGNGVPKNDEIALKWVRRAAEQGNAVAQNELGLMYRVGQGVSRDKEEAVRWYHKAAKQGNPQAMFNLGVSCYNGDGVPSNPILAYAWFLLAKEAGNPAAEDAVKRSAEENGRMGTPDALQQVAAMYAKGDDLPQSYSEAAKWYSKAADLSPQAAVKLASILIGGQGVPRDYDRAMTLCQEAAKQGYVLGQYCVGYLYQHGLGRPAGPKEAAKWYAEASKGGEHQAAMTLAEMYWKGEGVAVDRPEAYCYLFLAQLGRRAPDADAKAQAQKLWKEMSKDDIKHLEKKLRDLHYDPRKVISSMQAQSTPDPAK